MASTFAVRFRGRPMNSSPSASMPSQAEAEGAILQVARVGIVAYGVVYLVLGWIAVQLGLGGTSEDASTQGALRELASQSFGGVLMWIVVGGLGAMVVWQLTSAFWGESWLEGSDRTFEQAKHVGRAIAYGALAVAAFRIVTSVGSGGSGSPEETITARLLQAPAGQFLVGLVGLGIVAIGVYQVRSGLTESFTSKLAGASPGVVRLGQVGYVAKGVTFAIVGGLFGWAALTADPDKAGGMDQALQTLRSQPFGSILLVTMGVGFAAYGVFCFAWARHPRP
jgi:hypothetical protein